MNPVDVVNRYTDEVQTFRGRKPGPMKNKHCVGVRHS